MIADQIPAIAGLSLEQKWRLAVELWDEVESRQEEFATRLDLLQIVEKRFADYECDPSTAMTLDEFKHKFHLP